MSERLLSATTLYYISLKVVQISSPRDRLICLYTPYSMRVVTLALVSKSELVLQNLNEMGLV